MSKILSFLHFFLISHILMLLKSVVVMMVWSLVSNL